MKTRNYALKFMAKTKDHRNVEGREGNQGSDQRFPLFCCKKWRYCNSVSQCQKFRERVTTLSHSADNFVGYSLMISEKIVEKIVLLFNLPNPRSQKQNFQKIILGENFRTRIRSFENASFRFLT